MTGHPREEYLGLGFFVHPVVAVAVFTLLINDHVLKARYPGFLTGKLSDFAGVFFFPLFLCAVAAIGARFIGRRYWLGPRGLRAAILITDFIFVSVKMVPLAHALYLESLGKIGIPSHLVMDATDLFALAMNPVTYLYGRRFWRTPTVAPP